MCLLFQFQLAYIVLGFSGKKIILSYNKKILLAVSRSAKLSQFHDLGCCGGLLILCKFGPSTAGQNVVPFSLILQFIHTHYGFAQSAYLC